jgi:hypothetical protein
VELRRCEEHLRLRSIEKVFHIRKLHTASASGVLPRGNVIGHVCACVCVCVCVCVCMCVCVVAVVLLDVFAFVCVVMFLGLLGVCV